MELSSIACGPWCLANGVPCQTNHSNKLARYITESPWGLIEFMLTCYIYCWIIWHVDCLNSCWHALYTFGWYGWFNVCCEYCGSDKWNTCRTCPTDNCVFLIFTQVALALYISDKWMVHSDKWFFTVHLPDGQVHSIWNFEAWIWDAFCDLKDWSIRCICHCI